MKICILSTFPAYGKVRVNQALKGGDGREGGCKREKKGTQATRAASFAFRPLFQLSQLSLQRPIRIRRALLCMTNFTRECIAKGGFVAVGIRKSSQQNVGAATPTKICKSWTETQCKS